jgi:hypothetical protein
VGYGEDLNLYAYVRNDSVNAFDPTGLGCEPSDGVLICDPPGDEIGEYTIPNPDNHPGVPESDPNYNDYTLSSSTPAFGPDTLAGTTEAVIRDPTPGDDAPATAEGALNNAGINPFATRGPLGDQVRSFVTTDSNGNTVVVNLSVPDNHIFNPSVVSQVIRQNGSGTSITLVGESASGIHAGGDYNPINLTAQSIFQQKIDGDIREGVSIGVRRGRW